MAVKNKIISRGEVENRIAHGEMLVIYQGKVLKVDGWKDKHPGGVLILQHFVGWDATEAINAYHSNQTQEFARKFAIGSIDESDTPWVNFLPPVRGGKFTKTEADGTTSFVVGGVRGPGAPANQQPFIDLCVDQALLRDKKEYPAVDQDTQKNIVDKYYELRRRLEADGLFKCNYWHYVGELFKAITSLSLAYYFFSRFKDVSQDSGSGGKVWLFMSALCVGFCWHQGSYCVHDFAHHAVTHNYYVDNICAIFIASWVGGLSAGWWKMNHNTHHVVTNMPEHDPDVQYLPFIAVCPDFLGNVFSSYYEFVFWYDKMAQIVMPLQRYTYYFLLSFGRFNLYRLAWTNMFVGKLPWNGKHKWMKWLEIGGIVFFNYWFTYRVCYLSMNTAAERALFILTAHVITVPLHITITMSHFGMSTSDFGPTESFPQHQARTTMDIVCPRWLDWLHGGLQFQVIHHFFPRMPRTSFRKATEYLKDFCDDVDLKYTAYEFVEGSEGILTHLGEIGKQARIFNACAKFNEEECGAEFANAILAVRRELAEKAEEELKEREMREKEKIGQL